MAQIVQGTNWAEQLGTGLGSGLQALAQNKINQLKQRHGLGAVGYTPEQADQLSYLDPQILNQIVKQKLQEPTQEGYAQLVQALLGGEQQAPLSEAENFSMGQRGVSPQQQAPQMPGLANLFPQAFRQPQIQAQEQQKPQVQPATLTPNQEAQLLKRQQAGLPIPKRLTEKQANTLLKLGMQQQALSQKQQMAIDKETKPIYDEITRDAKAARDNDKRLDKIEEIVKRGKLSNPGFTSAVKTLSKGVFGFGIDLSHLLSADTQELNKITADFIRGAKDIFGGGRLTDADLSAFLQSVPSASMSNEGKLAVMENMRVFNNAAKLKKIAADEIIKTNGGRRPTNLDVLVEEKVGPLLDAEAAKIKARTPKQVPGTETLIGSTARAIPRLLF